MAAKQYRVRELSYIDGHLRQAGEVVEIDLGEGKAGGNLELVEDEAPAKKPKAKADSGEGLV